MIGILKWVKTLDFNNISIKKNKKIEICNFVIIVRELSKKINFFSKIDAKKPSFWDF
jgi:hypothetical protein